MNYIELNMVRCGVVDHPSQWQWSGYGELMGGRTRNRLLDVDKLLWLLRCGSVIEFRQHLDTALEQALLSDELERQAKWTEAIAVGERAFVEAIEAQIRSGSRCWSAKKEEVGFCKRSMGRFLGRKSGP